MTTTLTRRRPSPQVIRLRGRARDEARRSTEDRQDMARLRQLLQKGRQMRRQAERAGIPPERREAYARACQTLDACERWASGSSDLGALPAFLGGAWTLARVIRVVLGSLAVVGGFQVVRASNEIRQDVEVAVSKLLDFGSTAAIVAGTIWIWQTLSEKGGRKKKGRRYEGGADYDEPIGGDEPPF